MVRTTERLKSAGAVSHDSVLSHPAWKPDEMSAAGFKNHL